MSVGASGAHLGGDPNCFHELLSRCTVAQRRLGVPLDAVWALCDVRDGYGDDLLGLRGQRAVGEVYSCLVLSPTYIVGSLNSTWASDPSDCTRGDVWHQGPRPPVSAYLPPKPRLFRLVAVLGYSKPNCDDYDGAWRINNAHRRESADPNRYRAPKGRQSRPDRRPAGTEVVLRIKRSADRARNGVVMAGPLGAHPISTANADAELVARGERFERFLLEYMDAWLEWAPLMRAARAQVGDDIGVLITAIERTGCDAAQARMSQLERDMQPLAEEIIAAPATSLSGLRAKALVALWEALPSHAFHHGSFEFRDDGEASRSLFDAVAGMTGLTPLVRELEARLAADVELKGADA
jgi:hypothetical protein